MKSLLPTLLLVLLSWLPPLATAAPTDTTPPSKLDAILAKTDAGVRQDEPLYVQPPASTGSIEYRLRQEENRFYLILMITLATPVILLILLHYIRNSRSFTAQAIIHTSGLVLVIQATTIVVLASATSEQLTAAIGVLAAIAGYLFGSRSRREGTTTDA